MCTPRRRYQRGKRLINQVASIIIQTFWRNYFAAKYGHLKKQINAVAAVHMIQSIWRAHCNKRVYRYFRDLVMIKLKGAPADLLRTIIPNEIDLMDRAAGITDIDTILFVCGFFVYLYCLLCESKSIFKYHWSTRIGLFLNNRSMNLYFVSIC